MYMYIHMYIYIYIHVYIHISIYISLLSPMEPYIDRTMLNNKFPKDPWPGSLSGRILEWFETA